MKFKYRLGTAIASSAIMLQLLAPAAYADTNVTIEGNGANSNNSANVTNNNSTDITQSNTLVVTLTASSKADTGNNEANGNTGGDVTVTSGDATAVTSVSITGGANTATVNGCGCDNPVDEVKIKNNGVNSDNTSNIKNKNKTTASQGGTNVITGTIKSKAKTKKNKANNNTNGTVDVTSGDATSTTAVGVTIPNNSLTITP